MGKTILASFFLLLCSSPPLLTAQESAQEFDLIIQGGLVIDGSGQAGRETDLGIRARKIVAIGDLAAAKSARRIDAQGLVVAPGFIDAHAHADRSARPKTGGRELPAHGRHLGRHRQLRQLGAGPA